MTDEIERLEIAVVTCMEHAESLRHRITRLEASVIEEAEAAVQRTSADTEVENELADDGEVRGQRASTPSPASAVRDPLPAYRAPIRLRRSPDLYRIFNMMLYAASAALVGTLLSLASW